MTNWLVRAIVDELIRRGALNGLLETRLLEEPEGAAARERKPVSDLDHRKPVHSLPAPRTDAPPPNSGAVVDRRSREAPVRSDAAPELLAAWERWRDPRCVK